MPRFHAEYVANYRVSDNYVPAGREPGEVRSFGSVTTVTARDERHAARLLLKRLESDRTTFGHAIVRIALAPPRVS